MDNSVFFRKRLNDSSFRLVGSPINSEPSRNKTRKSLSPTMMSSTPFGIMFLVTDVT